MMFRRTAEPYGLWQIRHRPAEFESGADYADKQARMEIALPGAGCRCLRVGAAILHGEQRRYSLPERVDRT